MNTQRKLIFLVVAVGVFKLAFLALVIAPLVVAIASDSKKLLALRQELQGMQVLAESVKNFRSFADQTDVQRKEIDALLVDPETPVAFIEFLEQAAVSSNFELKITPGSPQRLSQDPWPSLEFRVEGRGAYPDVFAFVQKLESAPFLLDMGVVRITRVLKQGETDGGAKEAQFSISFKVFTKAQGKP